MCPRDSLAAGEKKTLVILLSERLYPSRSTLFWREPWSRASFPALISWIPSVKMSLHQSRVHHMPVQQTFPQQYELSQQPLAHSSSFFCCKASAAPLMQPDINYVPVQHTNHADLSTCNQPLTHSSRFLYAGTALRLRSYVLLYLNITHLLHLNTTLCSSLNPATTRPTEW